MHVEADKYNTGALVQKYETGIKGFFKDEDLVSWQPGQIIFVIIFSQAREFKNLESIKEKLTFIWKSKSMQVKGRPLIKVCYDVQIQNEQFKLEIENEPRRD